RLQTRSRVLRRREASHPAPLVEGRRRHLPSARFDLGVRRRSAEHALALQRAPLRGDVARLEGDEGVLGGAQRPLTSKVALDPDGDLARLERAVAEVDAAVLDLHRLDQRVTPLVGAQGVDASALDDVVAGEEAEGVRDAELADG